MNQLLAMRAFARVVETGSFSRAAAQLSLPRSSISKLVSDLEHHLGIKLMHRTTRAVETTPEGCEYYEHAARLLAEVDLADDAVRGAKIKPRGQLRIEAPASFANCLLIPALPAFHRAYPEVTLSVAITDRLVSVVGEGVDCAIRAGDLEASSMIARRLITLDYATCASASYLRERGIPRTPVDVENSHLRVGYFIGSTGKVEPLTFDNGQERFQINDFSFATSEGNGLIKMLLSGLGVGQQIRRFVQPYLDTGELVECLSDWSRPQRDYHVVYPSSRQQSGRLRVFLEWLTTYFAQSDQGRADTPRRPAEDGLRARQDATA